MNNNCYVRTLLNSLQVGSTDIRIGVLDSDLPSNVSFCKVASLDLSKKITATNNIPLLYTDQSRSAFIANTNNNPSSFQSIVQSNDLQRTKFWYSLVGGDSGNPACFVYNNKLILLLHFINPNGGYCAPFYINEINSIMNTLGGGYNLSIFNIEDIDPIVNSISIKTTNINSGKLIANAVYPAPEDILDLKLWLKAGYGLTLDGSDVIGWDDQSGNSNDGTALGSPIFVENAINGLPVIEFDGVSAAITGPAPMNSDNGTIFIVAKHLTDKPVGVMYEQYADGNDTMNFYRKGLDEVTNSLRVFNGGDLVSENSLDNNFNVLSTIINGASSKIYINNKIVAEGDAGSLNAAGDYYLSYWGAGDEYTNMQIAEVIVYNRALTSTEHNTIANYLNKKYFTPCSFRKTSKLTQISGNDAPIGTTFNNIAFDYSSFASTCSSLGLNPTTILNSLGGVDFSYNYVVIRAKTSSQINADSISDLGNGIINITNYGASFGVVRSYYRFFVMCREGWRTVRFYGVDYPIYVK